MARESDLYGLKVFAFNPLKYVIDLANHGTATKHEAKKMCNAYFDLIDKTLAERRPDLMQRNPLDYRQKARRDYA